MIERILPEIDFADPDTPVEGAHLLERVQELPVERARVFEFFSNPSNLEVLTPPWLNFRIVESPGALNEGALIRYQLRLHGIPINWKTKIVEWREGESFVDIQLAGPYRLWHHTHAFEDTPDGTLIRDTVRYRVPFGPVGSVARRLLVQPDIEKIFGYRREAILREFGLDGSSAESAAG
jgi:ligand-binding SRPBCC domain-containing protein